ncbi:pyrimidine/purine nucleoside phosphorylase [Pseudomonas monteilii]|uniref:pyrimidine/purine nucleoside phosphorylase n=1 Tax=Pseudomonas monteilii TaxID=76759 RepID=UPI0037F3134C
MQVNTYFDGAVKSIAFENSEGSATSGVMQPGQYQFSTSKDEKMVVTSGSLKVTLPGETESVVYSSGQVFNVQANCSFKVEASCATAYLCFYS